MADISYIERQENLRQLLKGGESLSVPDLAKRFSVSEMTIHRDLKKLESEGLVRKMRGGAVPAERMEFEFDFSARRTANQKAKRAIAAKAVELIKPGDKIILDTGTTTLELAYLLKDFDDLTVVTPSLAVASVLQFSTGVHTILLGGVICKGSPDLTGVVTEKVLDMFSVDIAFQGADGISLDGEIFNLDMRVASVDTKMRQRASKVCILCDSSKVGKTEFASNGDLSEVDTLITDNSIKPEAIKALEETGVKIAVVKI